MTLVWPRDFKPDSVLCPNLFDKAELPIICFAGTKGRVKLPLLDVLPVVVFSKPAEARPGKIAAFCFWAAISSWLLAEADVDVFILKSRI